MEKSPPVVNGLLGGLRTLPYVGGKSNFGGAGAWIASILGPVRGERYVEPCCGSLGILLRLEKGGTEICSDKDGRMINFFRTIRDNPGGFAAKLALTCERSEAEFSWAKRNLEMGCDIDRALATYIVLQNSIPASLIGRSCYSVVAKKEPWKIPGDIYALADRLRSVCFVESDGADAIRKYGLKRDALIYVDPPYPKTLGYDYDINGEDLLSAVVLARDKGARVAVSGFSDSWPKLIDAGFSMETRPIHLQMDTSKTGKRTEALFLSWIPDGRKTLSLPLP